jgi:hypothetical protein
MMTDVLHITLSKAGGYMVVVSKKDELPKLLDNDFIFPTGHEENVVNHFQLDPTEMSPGYYYLGFFNMDYYVHSACNYTLTLTMSRPPPNLFKPMMSIVMGVCFSIVLCIVMSICKRVVFRNMQYQLRSTGELVAELQTVRVVVLGRRCISIPVRRALLGSVVHSAAC